MLITLVIVGVVAALTISPLINTYMESSTVSKVKKGLSILGQAKKLAEVQNGSIEGWEYGTEVSAESSSQFWNYLKPHISVARDCGLSGNCLSSYTINYLKGTPRANLTIHNSYYRIILADGSVMFFRTTEGKCSTVSDGGTGICAYFFMT